MISGLKPGGTQNKRPYWDVLPRGYSHVKGYGDMSPILVKKIFRRGSHITKIAKNCKISHFCGRKTLRNVSRGFAKIKKTKTKKQKQKNVESAFFEGEKSVS